MRELRLRKVATRLPQGHVWNNSGYGTSRIPTCWLAFSAHVPCFYLDAFGCEKMIHQNVFEEKIMICAIHILGQSSCYHPPLN